MDREFHTKPCKACKGSGKIINYPEYNCSSCRGKKEIIREIMSIKDYFKKGEAYEIDAIQCANCKEWWGLDEDWSELDNNSFRDEVYRCDCGDLLEIGGEWDAQYRLYGNNIQ
jgi:hypothetical protein